VKRIAALLVAVLLTGCAGTSSPPATFGVDGAPQAIRDTYLTVARQAGTLAGYDATNDQWLDFARSLCADGITTTSELSEFVDRQTGSNTSLRQMWQTASTAATTAFCPLGES
jgi:outer membrane PBP1 activator LpoA protein